MLHGKQALKTFLFNPQIPKIPTNGQGYVPLVMVFVSRTVTNTNSRPGSGLSTCARCATSVDMNLLLLQEWTRWSWRLAACASCATSVDADDAAVSGVEQVISVTGYFCKLCHKCWYEPAVAAVAGVEQVNSVTGYLCKLCHKCWCWWCCCCRSGPGDLGDWLLLQAVPQVLIWTCCCCCCRSGAGDLGDWLLLQAVPQVLQQRDDGAHHALQDAGSLRQVPCTRVSSLLFLAVSDHYRCYTEELSWVRLIDWVVVLRPTGHKTDHFGDISPHAVLLAWYGRN